MQDLILGIQNTVSDPLNVVIFFVGLVGGMLFGAIPGLNAVVLAAILLPFTSFLTPTQAIMLLAVIYVSGVYGGAVTAILFNIPGSPENAPTAFDGYPMTKKGLGSKAITAAITCSAIGGASSAIIMMVATEPLANWAIRAFGPPELLSVVILGLCIAASVGTADLARGWLSICFGMLLATVGTDVVSGLPRYDFGSDYMAAGINSVPLILGFFAVSEIIVQALSRTANIKTVPDLGHSTFSLNDLWLTKSTVIRSTVIGFFAGLLPGVGATLASFVGYSQAVRWSKKPELYGKGELDGVVASETANNAATGGAMIPLLALGLPGGAMTAVMIGAFQLHGIQPGPMVLITSKELVWVVFISMFVANLAILPFGWIESKLTVHLLRVPFGIFGPIILMLSIIGVYAGRNLLFDVWVMMIAGIFGYIMRRGGYSMAAIVLGAILGKIGESSFAKTMQILDYNFFEIFFRPVSAIFLCLAAFSVVFSWYRFARLRFFAVSAEGHPEKFS